ncbi:MAG: CinA family nicotinamide mononucleotide deamidase-related protein [Verrucomicrobiota bacterium]
MRADRVEVINTGRELLLGTTINTNLALIARHLFPHGLRIERNVSVPDDRTIWTSLEEALGRADLVILSGGLGPTLDDLTRDAVAEVLGVELRDDEAVWEQIGAYFQKRGLTLRESARRQAAIPAGAEVLRNGRGTAPGFWIAGDLLTKHRARGLLVLPGPPRELEPMLLEASGRFSAVGLGEQRYQTKSLFFGRTGESEVMAQLEPKLADLDLQEIAYCAHAGCTELRVRGPLGSIEQTIAHAQKVFPKSLVSTEQERPHENVLRRLRERGETVAFAESCTGGAIASTLTDLPGSSEVFGMSWVTYSNEAKARLLGVDEEVLATKGAVSEEVARAMCEGALHASGADHTVAVTGIAGPGGGTAEKPVGTVWIGLASSEGVTEAHRFVFATDRLTFKKLVTTYAFDLLRGRLASAS